MARIEVLPQWRPPRCGTGWTAAHRVVSKGRIQGALIRCCRRPLNLLFHGQAQTGKVFCYYDLSLEAAFLRSFAIIVRAKRPAWDFPCAKLRGACWWRKV